MYLKSYITSLALCITLQGFAQSDYEHIGSGNHAGVEVNSSDTASLDKDLYSLTGEQLFPDLAASSRFLAQATLGHNWEDVEYLQSIGVQNWLDEQINMPINTTYFDKTNEVFHYFYDSLQSIMPNPDNAGNFKYAFYDKLFDEDDALRQKVAFALNQIVVTSSEGLNIGSGNAYHYDKLYTNAFGNYRDILYEVSKSYIMSIYLTFRDNKQADYALKTFPDENYAREIMQLFSIGVWELNNDGTLKLDAEGKTIPTYDNYDIEQLAKVFTGFRAGPMLDTTYFSANTSIYAYYRDIAYEESWHDKTQKTLVNDTVLTPGRTAEEDLNDAIDALFYHPNVAPFIAFRMIQQLVKSNPSPAYVNRVAMTFNNNGKGVRGDMGAVVKSILLDPEARDCDLSIQNNTVGKLIQPLERITKLSLAFDLDTPSGRKYFYDGALRSYLLQGFYSAPSVFNFFLPDYAESDIVRPAGLVSPEFEILNTNTSINYINIVENWIKNYPFNSVTILNIYSYPTGNWEDQAYLDFSDEILIYETQGINALMDRLDILLCYGNLTQQTRDKISNTIAQYTAQVANYSPEDAVKDVIFFIMISDFLILK